MRLVPEIQTTNFLALTSELFGKSKIINLPEKTEYSFQDTLNVLLHAATSSTNSIESASIDLRMKTSFKNVPSADSIHGYINSNSIDYMISSFRQINTEIIKHTNLKGTYQDAAIDFHDIPYYGEINTSGIRGIKPKNGTSWGYSFCSLDIIGDIKLTLDVIDINGLAKNYPILIGSLLKNVKSKKINIKTLLMDREFFNSPVISTLHTLNQNYIIAAKSNKKINSILLEHKKKFGETSTVFEYQFKKGGPKFNIVAIHNPKYDPKDKNNKGNHEYHLFATDIMVTIASDITKKIPEEYRKRWNIETGYRLKNAFKIRTCSKSPIVRTLLFLIQCLLYNIESLLKQVIEIDAYKLKSAISDAIVTVISEGYKALFTVPLQMFIKSLREYNENRNRELVSRLRII
ncbi:MAG: ISH3 family transposase [Candidatus Methanoperedens sp.]|nr:ISH3 family transposase [Candidatus Methanoperedens sp.]